MERHHYKVFRHTTKTFHNINSVDFLTNTLILDDNSPYNIYDQHIQILRWTGKQANNGDYVYEEDIIRDQDGKEWRVYYDPQFAEFRVTDDNKQDRAFSNAVFFNRVGTAFTSSLNQYDNQTS